MKSRRPRGLAGYTPDWREKMSAEASRRRPVIPRRKRRPARPDAGREPAPGRRWRRIGVVLALAEAALLAWLLTGPALAVRNVRVEGAQHLSAAQVVAAAGLARPGSILTVDGAAAAARLARNPWVRSSTVTESLPGQVLISVEEWQPAATYQAGAGSPGVFLNDQAEVVGPAPAGATPLSVVGPAGTLPRPGSKPLDPLLLAAMVNIQKAFPSVVGLTVGGYTVDASGDLTLVTSRGWPIRFGRVLTPEQFAGLQQQLAALKSVSACVDFRTAPILYVNVMNPSAPDVRFKDAGPRPCR